MDRTENNNLTSPLEFVFLGYSNLQNIRSIVFVTLLLTYTMTLMGNITIIIVTWFDIRFHTPMYFFLWNLSFLDICYPSVTIPKVLKNLLSTRKTISFPGCITQLYFFISMEGIEAFLLTAMAYDRYVAICNPLRYMVIMSKRFCSLMAVCSWLSGFLNSLVHTLLIFQLPFCRSNGIHHFFCDIPPLLQLSCVDTYINEILVFTVGGIFVGLGPFLSILLSYFYIITTILKMNSAEGRRKAFSTCVSHLTVVTLFYGTTIFMYVRPSSSYDLERDMVVSLMYSIVTPMFNPLIYSLRNKDVKRSLGKAFVRIVNC
uniref:Olfactory receptor n=1 Tax=Geotrypetes seraphini TaxID=260995 RepID=A0A6P8PWD7_GEOSA|nr:olfactory receptor 5V1-like [Geotrypetes seraphini]